MRRAAAALVVVALAGTVTAATASAQTTPSPDEAVLAAAQASRDYPLYWLGRSFEGLPLVGVTRSKGGSTRVRGIGVVSSPPVTSFMYGCEPYADGSGCVPPVAIQISPVCAVPPLVTPGSPRPVRHIRLRGARAFLFPGDRWELVTRHASVRVFGGGGRRGRRVMEALAGFNPPTARVAPGDALPAPDPRALRGRLPCQRAFDFLGLSGIGVERIARVGSAVRVELINAPLAAGAIRIVDPDPSDGRARLEIAGRRAFRSGQGEGVTVAVRTLPRRRAAVVLSVEPGRFESVRTRLLRSPARLIVELVPPGG